MAWFDHPSFAHYVSMNGLPRLGWRQISGGGATTLAATDRLIDSTNIPAGDHNITLLAASSYVKGTTIWFTNSDGSASGSKVVNITPAGTDKLQGTTGIRTVINAGYGSIAITTDGTEWIYS